MILVLPNGLEYQQTPRKAWKTYQTVTKRHAVFSLLLVRMIMRLRLHVRGVDRFGLKLEPEQFSRRAARTFELRLLTGGLPTCLPETQF